MFKKILSPTKVKGRGFLIKPHSLKERGGKSWDVFNRLKNKKSPP